MYAITGATGKVGGTLARSLLALGERVRVVLRDQKKAAPWVELGCEVSVGELHDPVAMTAAFTGAEAVFVLPPPVFDPAPGYAQMRDVAGALSTAIRQTRPARVLCLSTVGAQAKQDNLLSQLSLMEQTLGTLPVPVRFLRPAWFLENAAWDVRAARTSGLIQSFLAPLERAIPMVSTLDVGFTAAELIRQPFAGGIVELEGPRRVSPLDLAAALGRALGRPVRAQPVPRDTWNALFRDSGMHNPTPRERMLDGFNAGWIDFEGTPLRGRIDLDAVIAALVEADRLLP